MRLQDSLQECTLALLRKIAAVHGISTGEDALRIELAGLILQRLAGAGYLAGFLSTLPAEEIEVLEVVAGYDWTAKAFVLDRKFPGRAAEAGKGTVRSREGSILSLLQKGLLYRSFGPIGSWRGEVHHVPEELRPPVSAHIRPKTQPMEPGIRAEVIPHAVVERDCAFDLFCLLSFLRRRDRGPVRGLLSREDLAKLEQETETARESDGGEKRETGWPFLVQLCLAGGWLRRDGTRLRPGRGAERLLSGRPQQLRTRLLDRYLKDRSWSDLAAAGRVRQPLGSRRIDEAAARRLLLHYIGELCGGEWTTEKWFRERLHSTNPDFLREDYSSLSWAVLEVATDAEMYGPDSWDAVEGEWIAYVLRGPLFWLGAVQWGVDPDGKVLGFRLRQGADLADPGGLGGDPAAGPGISFGPDFSVRASRGCDLALLYRLEPYLHLEGRRGASRYRLTRESLLAGLERGGSGGELEAMFDLCPQGPPAAVLQAVREWTASYGRYALEPGLLLVAASEQEADRLPQLEGVGRCLLGRLGSRSYRVAPERMAELVHRLKLAGHQPRVDPSARWVGARSAAGDLALLGECLFALMILRSLDSRLELEKGAEALRRLEAALPPEEVEEIARRAEAALRKVRAGKGTARVDG